MWKACAQFRSGADYERESALTAYDGACFVVPRVVPHQRYLLLGCAMAA